MIQSNKILLIFLCLQAKLLLFQDYKNAITLRKQLRNFLPVVHLVKSSLFYLQCCKQKLLLKQTEHWELNSFANMVAKIDIKALKFKNK